MAGIKIAASGLFGKDGAGYYEEDHWVAEGPYYEEEPAFDDEAGYFGDEPWPRNSNETASPEQLVDEFDSAYNSYTDAKRRFNDQQQPLAAGTSTSASSCQLQGKGKGGNPSRAAQSARLTPQGMAHMMDTEDHAGSERLECVRLDPGASAFLSGYGLFRRYLQQLRQDCGFPIEEITMTKGRRLSAQWRCSLIVWSVQLPLFLDGRYRTIQMFVLPGNTPMLCGRPTLKALGMTMDFAVRRICIGSRLAISKSWAARINFQSQPAMASSSTTPRTRTSASRQLKRIWSRPTVTACQTSNSQSKRRSNCPRP